MANGPSAQDTAQWRSEREISLPLLCLWALLTGVAVGLAACGFKALLALVFHLGFHGELRFAFTPESFTGLSPLGPWVIVLPVVGGLAATWLVERWAPEIRGSGVPELLRAIYYNQGQIRPRVAPLKALAATLTMGTGAPVGREGPIIQVGATIGSVLGQLRQMRSWQRVALLTAGGGAAIAATFNTPLGGVLFALELLMPEVSARTFLPLVLATGTATYVGRLIYGAQPIFLVELADLQIEPTTAAYFGVIAGFGLVCGVLALVFIQSISLAGTWFRRLSPNPYLRHALGLLAVGLAIYAMGQVFGRYVIQGPGSGAVQAFLDGSPGAIWALVLVIAVKFVTTAIALGSGAVGGIFAPVLVLGAGFGMAVGLGLEAVFPGSHFVAQEFALLGMAGALGPVSGAAMTAIVMIFEMTQDYALIVPLMLVTGLAFGVRRSLLAENAYTIQLSGRGLYVPEELHTDRFRVRHVEDYMDRDFVRLPQTTRLHEALANLQGKHGDGLPSHILLTRGNHIAGTVPLARIWSKVEAVSGPTTLADVADTGVVLAHPDDRLEEVLERLAHHPDGSRAIVCRPETRIPRSHDVVGIVDKAAIAEAVLADQQG